MNESSNEVAAAFSTELPSGGLYIGTALRQRIDLIEHLLEFGHQVILLCGAAASGKSTLLRSLAADAGARWHCVDVRGGPALGGRALLETVAQAATVGVEPGEDDATLLDRLRQRAAQMERAGKLLVLLLDDADQLSPDAIASLLALARHDEAGAEPRVLMTADEDHAALLSSLQRDDPHRALVHVIEIPPLNDAQVEAFLAQRARAVGLALEDCLDADALAAVAADGEGNPGKILALARQASTGQLPVRTGGPEGRFARQLGQIGSVLSKRAVLVGASALGVCVLGALLWLGRPTQDAVPNVSDAGVDASEGPGTAAEASDPGRKQIEISLPSGEDAASTSSVAPSPVPENAAASGAAVPAPLPAESPAPSAELPDTTTPMAAPPPTASDPQVVMPATNGAPVAAAAAGAAAIAAASAPPVAADKPAPLPASASKKPDVSRKPLTEQTAKRSSPPSPAKPERATKKSSAQQDKPSGGQKDKASAGNKPKPVAEQRARAKPPEPAGGARATPGSGYTLQLIGVKERAAANDFIRKHKLAAGARVIESRRNGQPWFTVAYGSYANRAAANAAIEALPASVRRATTPWVRAVNGRQKAKK